jgi:hypothetical protein
MLLPLPSLIRLKKKKKKRTNAEKCFFISASCDAQISTSTHPIISGLGMSLHVSSSFPNL